MSVGALLYANSYDINEHISIHIPTVGEIMDSGDLYDSIICTIVATPYDLMVQLDDIGIDFSKITDFDLFCLLFNQLQSVDTSMVFGDLDLKGFKPAMNKENDMIVLLNEETGVVIDKLIHATIADFLRKILCIKKNDKRPGNEDARLYMIEKERRKQKRAKRKKQSERSQLENLIIALVNTAEFPYNYQTVRDISIYQFYTSLHQISHKVNYDNTMVGVFAGTVKLDDLPKEDRTWIMNT